MGKRSDFKRRERDFYATPKEAVIPLLPHLAPGTSYHEPCAGDGALIQALAKHDIHSVAQSDIFPQQLWIEEKDVFEIDECAGDCFISNSPWNSQRSQIGCEIAKHLSDIAPTWLLFPADYAHNLYFGEFRERLVRIVSVGRLKWIKGSKDTGKENCAWYLFDKPLPNRQAHFFLRTAA